MTVSEAKKIAGIILAAGGSRRMGQPKLLLEWHGAPLIRWVARTALGAGCSPLIVVTGSDAAAIESVLDGLTITFTRNPDWELGQSTSLRAGIKALPATADAVIVFLADQPHISLQVVMELMRGYREEDRLAPILIASSSGKRGNPVLFDRVLFNTLTQLEGDTGARTIFAKYPIQLIPFDDPDLHLDVDSPQDYEKLIRKPAPVLPPE